MAYISIFSDNLCYGPAPAPEAEVQQKLSIFDNGIVDLIRYKYGAGYPYKLSEEVKLEIHPENAADTIDMLTTYFQTTYRACFMTDVGVWKATWEDKAGNIGYTTGPLIDSDDQLNEISNWIRVSLSLDDLFCFDGNIVEDYIEQLTMKYHHVVSGPNKAVGKDYKERLTINRNKQTLIHVQKYSPNCEVTHTYYIQGGISQILDKYGPAAFLEEKRMGFDDAADDPNDRRIYTLTVRWKKSAPTRIHGNYNKDSLPSVWMGIIEDIRTCFSCFEGDILNPKIYRQRQRRIGDLMFVFVTAEEYGREYSYLCNDTSVSVGDWVKVPMGYENQERLVKVCRVLFAPAEEAPYPMDKIKTVLGKSDSR